MTTITDDEREAREWLLEAGVIDDFEGRNQDDRHRATILALLDAPRMPRPEDVPRGVLEAMERVFYDRFGSADSDDMRGAYRALYDHYSKPPKMTPKQALHAAIADIQWMSAASDFGPDGQAHHGWVKVRDRLNAYEAALRAMAMEMKDE